MQAQRKRAHQRPGIFVCVDQRIQHTASRGEEPPTTVSRVSLVHVGAALMWHSTEQTAAFPV